MNQTKIRTSSTAICPFSTTSLLLLVLIVLVLSVVSTIEATMDPKKGHNNNDLNSPLPILIHLASLPHPEPYATLHPTRTRIIQSQEGDFEELHFPPMSSRRPSSDLQSITLVTPHQNPTLLYSRKNNPRHQSEEELEPSAEDWGWSGPTNLYHIPRRHYNNPTTIIRIRIKIKIHNSTQVPSTSTSSSPSFLLLRLSHTPNTNSKRREEHSRRKRRSISSSSSSHTVTTPAPSDADHVHALRHLHALRHNRTREGNRSSGHHQPTTTTTSSPTPPPQEQPSSSSISTTTTTTTSPSLTTSGCRLHTLALTPAQIQLPGVSWPKKLELGFCEGSCPFPLTDDRYNYSLHALYLDKYRLLWNHHIPENMPKSTCVPATYKSTSLVVEVDGGEYEIKVLHDLSVSTCGCR